MVQYIDLGKFALNIVSKFLSFKAECNIPPSPIVNTIHLYLGIKCHSYT